MSQYEFILPETFDAVEFFPGFKMRRHQDSARWLINTLMRKMARQWSDEVCDPVHLNAAILRQIMGRSAKQVVDHLLAEGAIQRVGGYSPGDHSYGYVLAERYSADRHVRVRVTNRKLIERLARREEQDRKAQARLRRPIHDELDERQRGLRIDGDAARRFLHANPACNPFDCQGVLITGIEQRHFRLSVSKYGRVFNSVCNLKKELRRTTLHADGERLAEVDIRNSQPSCLAYLLSGGVELVDSKNLDVAGEPTAPRIDKVHMPVPRVHVGQSERRRFIGLARAGQIYDYLLERLGDATMARSGFKIEVMTHVLAKRGHYPPPPVEQCFADEFPGIRQFILEVNRHHHATLIRLLQKLEAWLVVSSLSARLAARCSCPFVTIHDAICCPVGQCAAVEEELDRVISALQFPGRWEVA